MYPSSPRLVVADVCVRAAGRATRTALLLLPLPLLLLPLVAHAKLPAGTGITASTTASGHLTSTSRWTIAKSADPASQAARVGQSASVHWAITTTKSDSATLGAYLDGQVCVTNTGGRATEGLAIQERLTQPPSTDALNTVAVDVGARPQLDPGEAHCYPYTISVPPASIVPSATYKDIAEVTITNHSCCPGSAVGPSPSATAALPATPIPIDDSITVTDTNGQSFDFGSGGTQDYVQGFECPDTTGNHTLDNTATVQSTGQTASAEATVACHVYPQSNALDRPVLDALSAFANDCVSFYVDTQESQSCNFPCDGLGPSEDHHQGLARTQKVSADDSIDFFLSHSRVSDSSYRGQVMQFGYGGSVDDEHVTGAGVTALLDPPDQSFDLDDEQHPSDIDFLPDMDGNDSGYLFVTKEFGLDGQACEPCSLADPASCGSCTSHKVTVYYWEPGHSLQAIGDIVTPLVKPSHVLIDRKDDYYYLIVLDNSFKIGVPYRAYYADLFPTSSPGSLDVDAFQPLHYFSFNGDLGSQAKLVRDSTDTWYVLVYTATDEGNPNGDDYIYVRDITLGDEVTLGDGPAGPPPPSGATGFVHVILPPGETSFTNSGTHYVDHNGRLLISSSERWSHDVSDAYGYVSRVDECR